MPHPVDLTKRDLTARNLQPLSEMPIWARLAFAEMVHRTYFWDEQLTEPRHVAETEVAGFVRIDDTIWLYFYPQWLDGPRYPSYIWYVTKDSTKRLSEHRKETNGAH